jgi:hypothetical protein
MEHIIIGIHGLGNKPAPHLLQEWWRQSLSEGFRLINHPRRSIPFELVYWADILYPLPYDPDIADKKDVRFLDEPYRPSPGRRAKLFAPARKKILDLVEKQLLRNDVDAEGSPIWQHINDLVIHNFFKDLAAYYDNDVADVGHEGLPVRDAIRKRLADKLNQHRDKRILLIAHSMGSIIAYDVLTLLVPDLTIDTLVTIGSPLGVPAVMHKIREELSLTNGQDLPTPENIGRWWYNHADLTDKVAFHYRLADDFLPNRSGVLVTDIQVVNDYAVDGDANPHKVYGYLRTPEMAQLCFGFLSAGQSRAGIRRRDLFNKALDWLSDRLRLR